MPQGATNSTSRPLGNLRGFAFDLDGTIWEGPSLLPGAATLVADLRAAGLGVVFASNCSRYGSDVLCRQLALRGITATPAEVVAAFDLVGDEVLRRQGPVRVLAIGTEELAAILESSGHTSLPVDKWQEAQAVVVGIDPDFNYGQLRAAARAVAAGAAFFTINMDARFPVGPSEFDPGCGALAEAIAVAGGARPVVIGKPQRPLFHAAVARLGCAAQQAAMVGDSQFSDIDGGRAAGMFTIWLDPELKRSPPFHADLVVRNLEELHELWQMARAVRQRQSGP
jgi:4-nitrophenyl phosphatase